MVTKKGTGSKKDGEPGKGADASAAKGTDEDLLADVNLASLMKRRAEIVESQKKAAANVEKARAGHFVRFWLGGGVMFLAALWLGQELPGHSPVGIFLLSACIIFWLGMWTTAFLSGGAVRELQDKAAAVNRQLGEIDHKIAFCHQVLEEAKRVRVRSLARALVEKEAAAKKSA